MAKKMITLSINHKLVKIDFIDIRKVHSRKPKKFPKIPSYNPF